MKEFRKECSCEGAKTMWLPTEVPYCSICGKCHRELTPLEAQEEWKQSPYQQALRKEKHYLEL